MKASKEFRMNEKLTSRFIFAKYQCFNEFCKKNYKIIFHSSLKGICIGIIITIIASSTVIFAAKEIFQTANGSVFDIAHLAVGKSIIPLIEMPDNKPPIIVDGRTYVPLRAAVNAVGGDVSWDDTIKTATVTIADTIQIRKNGNIVLTVERYTDTLQVVTIISPEFLMPLQYYDTCWTIEKDGRTVKEYEVKAIVTGKNEGVSNCLNCDYKFADTGTYTIKFKIMRAGTSQWLTVAQKKVNIN